MHNPFDRALHQRIEDTFNQLFSEAFDVRMCGGGQEPLYTPAYDGQSALLVYREDFAASALHEAAHWCIAGAARRQQMDFGYTYCPPPRSSREQQQFFTAELKVQTLESLFALAARVQFQVSCDNLEAHPECFARTVVQTQPEVRAWMDTRAGSRARRFERALGLLHT